MTKKKICIVMGGHFSSTIGGAQLQAQFIVDQLVLTGKYDIYYLARHVAPDFKPIGYSVFKIKDMGRLSNNSFLMDAIPLYRALKQINPDVIYQRGLKGHTAICALFSKLNAKKMVFHIAHDYDVCPTKYLSKSLLSKLDKIAATFSLRYVSHIVAQSGSQKELLLKNLGLDASLVFPNMVMLPKETKSQSSTNTKITWVANFKEVKQPEVFVELVERFKDREDVEFVMIGRDGGKEHYGWLHDRMKKLHNLRYLGELSIDEVNRELSTTDIFVNTSKAEGYPNTFLQAWIRRVPVVSLNVDVEKLLERRILGRLAGSFDGLVNAINELIDSPALRQAIGDKAEQYVLANNSPAIIQNLVNLFESVPVGSQGA